MLLNCNGLNISLLLILNNSIKQKGRIKNKNEKIVILLFQKSTFFYIYNKLFFSRYFKSLSHLNSFVKIFGKMFYRFTIWKTSNMS